MQWSKNTYTHSSKLTHVYFIYTCRGGLLSCRWWWWRWWSQSTEHQRLNYRLLKARLRCLVSFFDVSIQSWKENICVYMSKSRYEIFGLSILLLYLETQWMGENGWLTSGAMGFDNNVQIGGNAITWMLCMVWYFYAFQVLRIALWSEIILHFFIACVLIFDLF